MKWIEAIWQQIMSASQFMLIKLDPLSAGYLEELADRSHIPRQQAAQDLLRSALADQRIAEAHLDRWRALTPRQQQVAALACLNFTNRQIAARLGISPQTVKSHMRNLLHSFGLQSKAELRETLADWDFSERL